MTDSKSIGRKVTFKYCLAGVLIMALIILIIGAYFFYYSDGPINIGGKRSSLFWNGLHIAGIIVAGYILISLIGGWSGRMIINDSKSPYMISVITLSSIFMILATMTGQLGLAILGVMMALSLGHFMGREIKRKGKTTPQSSRRPRR